MPGKIPEKLCHGAGPFLLRVWIHDELRWYTCYDRELAVTVLREFDEFCAGGYVGLQGPVDWRGSYEYTLVEREGGFPLDKFPHGLPTLEDFARSGKHLSWL
jgi:hypothetical protein